jgi:competence ComEA-like helix-hairpin-helix protein
MDAAPPPARPAPVPTAWPRPVQAAAAVLLALAVILLAVHTYGYLPHGTRPTELGRRIDINTASRAELLQLPGIGPEPAEHIETYRREHEFRSVEELIQVPGVGPELLDRVRPWVYVDPQEHEEPDEGVVAAAEASPPMSRKAARLTRTIDVNRASAEELRELPGIGPKLSQAIVAERARAPFRSADDLLRVPGIGKVTLERLRPHVTADEGVVRAE